MFGFTWYISFKDIVEPFVPGFNQDFNIAEAEWLKWFEHYGAIQTIPVDFGERKN